jgi:hypothetical protein
MLGPHPRRVWRPNGAEILVVAKYISAATRYIPQSAILNTTSDPSSPSCFSCDNPCSILPSSIITPPAASEREAANNLSSASGKRVAHRRQVSGGKSIATFLHIFRTLHQPFFFIGEISPKKKRKSKMKSEFAGFNRQK